MPIVKLFAETRWPAGGLMRLISAANPQYQLMQCIKYHSAMPAAHVAGVAPFFTYFISSIGAILSARGGATWPRGRFLLDGRRQRV